MLFADVILPLSLSQTFTYTIPTEIEDSVAAGMRVIVPVGRSKFYTGIVFRLHNNASKFPNIKPIASVIDEQPTVTERQRQLWQFIADYYCSSLGEVYRIALPPALRIESEHEITLVEEMLTDDVHLTAREENIVAQLKDLKAHRTDEFAANYMSSIRRLIDRGVVVNDERLVNAYKPKYTIHLSLHPAYHSLEKLQELRDELHRSKKQLEALELYIEHSHQTKAVERSEFAKTYGISPAIIKALVDKGVFLQKQRRIDRIDTASEASKELNPLTTHQTEALNNIIEQWHDKQVVLLHGAPASGKTEIYIHLIQQVIERGGQALLLLPEVGLTRRLTYKMKSYFGSAMGTYHSQCTSYERVETYNHQLSASPYQLIVGVRAALFLPYQNLKLVIVDDEHDMGYKQSDPSPRYHGRDLAIYLGTLYGAKVLLGTSTPSVDTYSNCHFEKYGLVRLGERYLAPISENTDNNNNNNITTNTPPRVLITDMVECRKQRRLKGHFSFEMIEAIRETLAAKHQVIVFQNRRGFAPYTECTKCGYVPRCPNCDVSLTVHKHTGALTCHYCGHTETWSEECPQCHSRTLTSRGFGTEQVEVELRQLFPDADISRLDLDTSRTTTAHDRIFAELECGKTDILVGTQMVTKGIDVDNVSLVCIVNADNLLFHSDFRAHERAFQIIGQAIGRCGRGATAGRVMIQTSQPDNEVIRQIVNDNFKAFFAHQMVERYTFHYPPYYRLIKILVRHTDKDICATAAYRFGERLRLRFANRVLGPDAPAIARIQNMYMQQIILKIEVQAPIAKAKQILTTEIAAVKDVKEFRQTSFAIDVDPQ